MDLARPLRVPILLGLLLAWVVTPASGATAGRSEAERLVFLLEYIGADYGAAVDGGKIIDPFEYQEMATFSRRLVEQADVLVAHGAPEGVRGDLVRLEQLVRQLAPWDEVRALSRSVVSELLGRLPVASRPLAPPDLRRGAAIYATSCAPCHGPAGGGDGFSDPAMDPPASSFREPRMNLLSPHQVFGALRFGIEGTAMPSFEGAHVPQELWDLAFHLMTLRDGFDPSPKDPGLPLDLADLVQHSNEELIRRSAAASASLAASDVDYYRSHPPADVPSLARTASTGAEAASPPSEHGLQAALQLQDAFTAVADRLLPSVVTVSSFERDPDAVAQAKAAPGPSAAVRDDGAAWQGADSEALLYPGFRRLRSGSGFVASAEGHILTSYRNVTRDDGQAAEVIDVELPSGRHVLSRLVGAEPTIGLAVVAFEVVSEHRPPQVVPVTFGDGAAMRVGHWTIAVGDPWGPERAYAVGTLAALPGRQCYQEQLVATLMQTSLLVHPEAYGGPLANIRGEVVGLLVPPPSAVALATRAAEFALPIDLTLNIYRALVVAESKRSPWLGFSVVELAAARRSREAGVSGPTLPRTGVYIDDLFEPSPAARAGIRTGDTLVAIDGHRLFSVLDFQKWLYLSGIGRTVRLEVFRDGSVMQRDIAIEERPVAATQR